MFGQSTLTRRLSTVCREAHSVLGFARVDAAFLVVMALGFLLTPSSRADESWIGKTVVQKYSDFTLRIGDQEVDRKGQIEFYKVEKVEGPWLWLVAEGKGLSGWAEARDVIPLDEAIPFYTDEIRLRPKDPFFFVLRAMVWDAKKESEIALGDLNEAIRLDPSHAWTYNWRGIIRRNKGDSDHAIADYNEAIKINPNYGLAFANRGVAWCDKKEYDKAVADLSEAIRLDPEDSRNYDHRGWAWYSKREYDKAIADYDKAVQLDPKLVDAYINRGVARFTKKEYDKAIADYDKAIELDPKDATAYNDRGWAWHAKQEETKAIADFNQALKINPRFVRAYTNRGMALSAKQKYDQAIADFDRALQIDPHRARTLTQRGIAWSAKREYDRAISDFDLALGIDPNSIWSEYNRLIAYLNTNPLRAVREARNLLDRKGWNNELSIHTALLGYFAARETRKPDEAKRFLADAAVKSDSKAWPYPVVRLLRGEIDEKGLLTVAGTPTKETEARFFLGMHSAMSGNLEKALNHLRWIKEHGVPRVAEYQIAMVELQKLEQTEERSSLHLQPNTESAEERLLEPSRTQTGASE